MTSLKQWFTRKVNEIIEDVNGGERKLSEDDIIVLKEVLSLFPTNKEINIKSENTNERT